MGTVVFMTQEIVIMYQKRQFLTAAYSLAANVEGKKKAGK